MYKKAQIPYKIFIKTTFKKISATRFWIIEKMIINLRQKLIKASILFEIMFFYWQDD